MNSEDLRKYVLAKPGAAEDFPFDATTLVLKVKGKMFALVALNEDPLSVTLKCDPQRALFLRDMYPAVQPGYHMNKEHWNTILLDGTIPEPEIQAMIDESYVLVVKGLTAAVRRQLLDSDQT